MSKSQIPSPEQLEKIKTRAISLGCILLEHLSFLMEQDEKYTALLPALWRESPCCENRLPKDRFGAWYELFHFTLTPFIFDPETGELRESNIISTSNSEPIYILLAELRRFLEGAKAPFPQWLELEQEADEQQHLRAFYKSESDKLDELDKDEKALANLPPAKTLKEIQKRKAKTAEIQGKRDKIIEALKRDDAYDILFGGAEPGEYDHQSRDVAEGTQLSFYKHGDYWNLGKEGQEVPLRHLKGLESIHFLLENPNKEIASAVVYHCGSQPSEEDTMPKHLKKGENKIWRDRPQLSEEDNLSVRSAEENYAVIDKKALSTLNKKLNELEARKAEIEVNPSGNPLGDLETKDAISRDMSQIKKVISEARGGRFYTANENARKNVQKNIRYALERIKDECPDLEPFLNNETIRTGKECCYSPDPDNTPEWIIHKPSH